jgi:hypothetical protein
MMEIRDWPGIRLAALAAVLIAGLLTLTTSAAHAQPMMDLRMAAGVPLPAPELPAGTVSVRVVRQTFTDNLSGQTVTFLVDGIEHSQVTTDETGRAQVDGITPGSKVRARVEVDGERLETQEAAVSADAGVRFVLAAGLDAVAEPPMAAVPGTVSFGANSRIVLDFTNELLNVYYVIDVVNPGPAPVDIGGPLVIDLPTEARSATMLNGATPQASVDGARVTVRGPFAPGSTPVNVAFTLPFSGDTAHLEQVWPAEAAPFTIFAIKTGDMDLVSPQLVNKQQTEREGQPLVAGSTATMPPGSTLQLEVTGLPHRPTWPRNTAFALAAAIAAIGLWAAFGPGARPRTA